MIDKKYLCDYTITVPIFSDEPTNRNICEYLIKNYRNIIIYCNSQKEGIAINNLMNSIQKNCSSYIDCNTNKTTRNNIINKYKKGDLPFLVNVKILVEGFDAPITKGICFMHMPSSKTTIIQIIGRALRLHENKNIANIILPFSSKSDEANINAFLKTMARNDIRIRKSYMNKKLGGYIDIIFAEDANIDENNNIELKYDLIYDKIGVLTNSEEIWEKRHDELKNWIETFDRLPSYNSKNLEEKRISKWCKHMKEYKKINNLNKYKINKLENIKYWTWNKEEKFNNMFIRLSNWIDINDRLPLSSSNNCIERELGSWCMSIHSKYKNKKFNKSIINKFEQLKYWNWGNIDIFEKKCEYLEKWIDNNNRLPILTTKDNYENNLGLWCASIRRYNRLNKLSEYKKNRLEKIKYWYWGNLKNNGRITFNDMCDKFLIWIHNNNKLPSSNKNNKEETKLYYWYISKIKNKHKLSEEEIIKLENIPLWEWKIKKIYLNNFNKNILNLKNWINQNNRLPKNNKANIVEHKLYLWCENRRKDYKNNKLNNERIIELNTVPYWYWKK